MNYMKLFGIAAFAIGAILYLASSDDHTVVVGEQDYDLGDHVKITVNTLVDLEVLVGENYSLNVTADEKDLNDLKIYVKGKTLVIENKRSVFKSWRGDRPEIRVSLPLLKKFTLNGSSDTDIMGVHGSSFKVVLNGSGNITFEGSSKELAAEVNGSGNLYGRSFETKDSEIDINGSGSMTMNGECLDLEIEVNGSGDFKGKNFQCRDVEVDIVGSGDLDVYASSSLDVDVMGSGDVRVYGDPDKIKNRSRKKSHVIRK